MEFGDGVFLEAEEGLFAEGVGHRLLLHGLLLRVVVEVIGGLCLRHNDYIIGQKGGISGKERQMDDFRSLLVVGSIFPNYENTEGSFHILQFRPILSISLSISRPASLSYALHHLTHLNPSDNLSVVILFLPNNISHQLMHSESSATDRDLLDSQSLVTEQEQSKYSERSFLLRAFGPIEAGAMRGSIFALLASAMGTGMFNLPYRINVTGVIPFIFFVIAGGLFSYLGMFLISSLIRKYKVQSYSEMSEKAYGKNFRKVAEFCLIIYPWGITVCFQVIFAKFIMQLLHDNFGLDFYEDRQKELYTQMGKWVRIGISVGAIILNLFFILKKEIGILQKVAIIGVISVIINVAIIAITFFFTGFTTDIIVEGQTVELEYEGIGGVDWPNLKWASLDGWSDYSQQVQGLASIIFCYVNHQLVFPLVFDLKNPSKRRLTKVFNRVHITEIIAYSMVGMCGYLLLEPFQNDRPINALVMASIPTISMAIGKCLMVVSLFFAVPLNLFPARTVMYETFSLQTTNKNHIALSLGLAFSGTLIAIVFQQVNSYFGLLGGTAGVMMAGAIPMICYWKLLGINSKKQMAMLIFMGVISLLGIVGAVLSVIDP